MVILEIKIEVYKREKEAEETIYNIVKTHKYELKKLTLTNTKLKHTNIIDTSISENRKKLITKHK